jgi:hypothetical protein
MPFSSSLQGLQQQERLYLRIMEYATATEHGGDPNPLDTTGLCLLSLDGGGVRGLSTLYILNIIIDRLNHDRRDTGLPQ